MRIGAHDPLRVGQAHRLDHVERPGAGFFFRDLLVDERHFHQLPADQHGRIEGGHRLLVDHGDLRAANGAQLGARQGRHVAPFEADRAGGDLADSRQVTHHRERDRRLAAARFADEPHRLARHDLAGKVHHGGNFPGSGEERDAEAVDFEDRFGHHSLSGLLREEPRGGLEGRSRPLGTWSVLRGPAHAGASERGEPIL